MSAYDRSVSAPAHDLLPERVSHLQMPEICLGSDAVSELDYQLDALGVDGDAHGLVVTDETLATSATPAG